MRTGTSTNNVALGEQDLYFKPMNTNIHHCLFGLPLPGLMVKVSPKKAFLSSVSY
jgi:hypothetical protein